MDIRIVSRHSAEQLCSNRPESIAHLISITGAKQQKPIRGFKNIKSSLWLKFDDLNEKKHACPKREHVEKIVEFGRKIRDTEGTVLIHCEAGISRSTAAAFVILCDLLGPGKEEEAMQQVANNRPMLHPNKIICEYGDRILNRNGRMIRICDFARIGFGGGMYSL